MRNVVIMLTVGVLVAGAIVASRPARASEAPAATSKVRVGVYDSRAIALAYGRSKEFSRELADAAAEHKKAGAEGNDKRAKEIEDQMKMRQTKMHWQVFYDGNIDNILELVKPNYPAIARKAGVAAIVRRVEFKDDSVGTVDVTEAMAAQCSPDANTLKMMRDMASKPPVSFEQMRRAEADGSL